MSVIPPSSDPLHGLNPEHLLDIASMPTGTDADTMPLAARDLPTLEEVAAAFPDLEVLELIGHGGMSAVFRARQPQLERTVALKVLPKYLAATPGFAERFTREGRVLARLSHPHIVSVHDFGERGGFWFLIMEYVDGVNLRQAMAAGRFTPEQALEVIPAICDALQFAHGQGVLHRDIKPENILLDARGGIKIADFGIAKILGEDVEGAMLLTQSGAKLGTAPYMAPEQIEKPSTVDHRADIYSLGVVFYEMLTGELPLGRFAAPSELSSVGGNIDEIVFRALAKERTRRQQSVGEFKTQVAEAGSQPQGRHTYRLGEPFEYQSKRRLCGLPLLHVMSGLDPVTGMVREAHGFFAVGDRARGVFAFGGIARGWFAFGGIARGLVAIGGAAFGLISIGGFALGLLFACGGFSVGTLALGGFALGWHGCGGVALGWHGFGGLVLAHTGSGGQVHAVEVAKHLQSMHPLTVWLASLLRHTWLAGVLWLPLSAGMWMVQWWARNEAAIIKGDRPKGSSSARIFWLLPALVAVGVVMWSAFVAFSRSVAAADSLTVIVPMLVTATGLLTFVSAVPLWLRLVPMNGFYGLRLPSTMNSEERWLDANAFAGRHLFGWSLLIMGAGLAGFYQLPRHLDTYPWAAFALVLASIVASTFSIWSWLRHHPVNGPTKKPSRLGKSIGQIFTAIVIAYFIKGFIFDAYRIASRADTGVAQGSHWIASKLDTGFASGDLIGFEHDSGHAYIARVMKREDKGLLLKRSDQLEAFFVTWNKIIGKLLFSHFTPAAVKAAGEVEDRTPDPQPALEGTATALEQKPLLQFLQIMPNGGHWQQPVYSPEGQVLDNDKTMKLKTWGGFTGSGNTKDSDLFWMKLWFEHPDFDEASLIGVTLTQPDGQPLPESNGGSRSKEASSLQHSVVPLGRIDALPERVHVTLSYSIGPWRRVTDVEPDSRTSKAFGDGAVITGFGDDSEHHAFIGWSKRKNDKESYDAVAVLKSGHRIRAFRSSSVTMGEDKNEVTSTAFPVPLRDIKTFQIRSREVKTVEFPNVAVPPLP